jgi:hypothetical protein
MQKLKGIGEEDIWAYDGMHATDNYDVEFAPLVRSLGYRNINELVGVRAAELDRSLNILDLFGGAYFLENLDQVSKIIGVRLKNIDASLNTKEALQAWRSLHKEQELTELIQNPKREILEGNLYESKTWRALKERMSADISGFDLIVCRPQGPFGHFASPKTETIVNVKEDGTNAREQIFAMLLDRVLPLLSSEEGVLLTQTPAIDTDPKLVGQFWSEYERKKNQEGFEFVFETKTPRAGDTVAVVRHAAQEEKV